MPDVFEAEPSDERPQMPDVFEAMSIRAPSISWASMRSCASTRPTRSCAPPTPWAAACGCSSERTASCCGQLAPEHPLELSATKIPGILEKPCAAEIFGFLQELGAGDIPQAAVHRRDLSILKESGALELLGISGQSLDVPLCAAEICGIHKQWRTVTVLGFFKELCAVEIGGIRGQFLSTQLFAAEIPGVHG